MKDVTQLPEPCRRARRSELAVLVLGFFALGLAAPTTAREYSLSCVEDYSATTASNLPYSCNNTSNMINEISSSASLGSWTRVWYWTNNAAYPQDWMEAATVAGGDDNVYMDDVGSADLSVWSGHGTSGTEPNNTWSMSFGVTIDGTRFATSPAQIKLGEQGSDGFGSDGDNEYVIMDASCSGVFGERYPVWYIWNSGILVRSHQGLAFHNSPNDAGGRLENFIENVDSGDSNASAWLDAGEWCILWWCFNSPIVFTFGDDSADALDRHNNESMRSPRSDPTAGTGGAYRWEYIDNGDC